VVKIEVTCDKCRTIITADRTKLAIETGPLQTTLATDPGSSHIDLCTDCAIDLAPDVGPGTRAGFDAVREAGRRRLPYTVEKSRNLRTVGLTIHQALAYNTSVGSRGLAP
jgi:hypothetical protein